MLIVFAVLEALALSEEHRAAYEAREAYDTKAYHTHTPEVDRAIADADNVRKQMKKEIAA